MAKNIVLLSDGTGNSAAKLFRTNVWRTYQSLELNERKVPEDGGPAKIAQIALYDDGVGTSTFRPLAVLGGAFGFGLKSNVCQLYSYLCRHYEPGDRIYCFGFSRGAFTIRMLVALIGSEGVLPVGDKPGQVRPRDVDRYALEAYRRLKKKFVMDFKLLVSIGRGLRDAITRFRQKRGGLTAFEDLQCNHETEIAFVGLFDTVAAYGLPIDELTRAWGKVFWPLQPDDWDLSGKVKRACHALSVDDPRHTFHPKLWNEYAEPQDADNIRNERISQVWFPGVHSNIGGGYANDGLAFTPLVWMLREATAEGLLIKPGKIQQFERDADVTVPMPDPRRGLGGSYRYNPRHIARLCNDTENRVYVGRPKIHHTVFDRIKAVSDYTPFGLPAEYAVVDKSGALIDGAGNPYEHPDQALSRHIHHQEKVWDLVWKRRVVYFLSVFVGGLFLLMPFLPGFEWGVSGQACVGTLCGLSVVLDFIQWFTPGFVGYWLDTFRANFDAFIGLLVVSAVLLLRGAKHQNAIRWSLGSWWRDTLGSGPRPVSAEQPPDSWIHRFRTKPSYKKTFRILTRDILPYAFVGVIGAAVLYLAVVTVSRVSFAARDLVFGFCPSVASAPAAKDAEYPKQPETFDLRSGCHPVSAQVEAGKAYKVTLVRGAEEWKDNSVKANLLGLDPKDIPSGMFLTVPLRRTLTARWLQPVIRIGDAWGEEHVLEPIKGSEDVAATEVLTARFTARRSGPVFLYFNDAVIGFLGNPFTTFYSNNAGSGVIDIAVDNGD